MGTHPCRKCLGSMVGRGRQCSTQAPCWCEQRWHPNCANMCANQRCVEKCGTGGVIEGLSPKKDFVRTDGKDWVGGDTDGYVFDHDGLGDTPRDWVVAPRKLKVFFTYQISALDAAVA